MKRRTIAIIGLFVVATLCCVPAGMSSPEGAKAGVTIGGVNTSIFAALLTAVVTMVTWAGAHIYTTIHEVNTRRRVARLEHLQTTIEEFYGPLLGITHQTSVIFNIATRILPVDQRNRIDQSRFHDKDIDAWRFLQEQYFFPLNGEAVSLLKTKSYLIGSQIPESFQSFLLHATQFECLFRLWRTTGIDTSQKVEKLGFPERFYDDVQSSFTVTREEYDRLLRFFNSPRK
jgi:hypothetical protein